MRLRFLGLFGGGLALLLLLALRLGPVHGAPVRAPHPQINYLVQPVFTCWNAVTVYHPPPTGPVTTYSAHFGYVAQQFAIVPQSESYTVPALSPLPPVDFSKGTYTDVYEVVFDHLNPPTWYVNGASATVVLSQSLECGVH